MQYEVNGVRINAIDEGEGPAILFLHGLGGSWCEWEMQIGVFSERFRCIAPAHRGQG